MKEKSAGRALPVAKVFVRTDDGYLMVRKRAPGTEKDNRLEHLGGHIEEGESPLEGMLRELREEETTGLLASEMQRQHPSPLRFPLEGAEDQLIFELRIDSALARRLRADEAESYGLETVSAETLENDGKLRDFRDQLTPKTLAIYRAMGRIV